MTPEEQAAADAAAAAAAAKAKEAEAAAAAAKEAEAAAAAAKAKQAEIDAEEANKKFDFAYVKKLRDEAAEARREAAEAKANHKTAADKVAEFERKELEAQGKHKEAADAAEARARKAEEKTEQIQATADKRYIDAEIKLAAQAAGAVDPADVLLFINREGIKLNGSDVVGAAEAVAALKESKKHLFQEAEVDDKGKARSRTPAPPPNHKGADKVDAFKLEPKAFQDSWDNLGKKAA